MRVNASPTEFSFIVVGGGRGMLVPVVLPMRFICGYAVIPAPAVATQPIVTGREVRKNDLRLCPSSPAD